MNIAVKELVYFSCGSGDLTLEFFSNRDENEGKKAHEYLQSQYNKKSKSEVYIKYNVSINGKEYTLHGFIDGVLNIKNKIIIEEIKSTTSDLDLINLDYHKEHLAQAKIYAYLYGMINNMDKVNIRLTYIDILSYETKSFDMEEDIDKLEDFVFKSLEDYIRFLNLLEESKINRKRSIEDIEFPFKKMRRGQRELMKAVYQCMKDEDILYAIAPTGIGKTMATIFSSLKSLEDMDKLFYLTAKGSGKNAPIDALRLLEDKGLEIKAIDIVAKRKICNRKSQNCNPEDCPFAKGYFDRLKSATMEIFSNYNIYDEEVISLVSNKHNICAFEFSLYLSYFCDIVIADYNYVFDPHAHLIRYFEDDTYKPKVLVDEAHNLISRSKEMYSSSISSMDIRILRKNTNGITPSIRKECNKAIELIEGYRDKVVEKAIYVSDTADSELHNALYLLLNKCDELLEENKNNHSFDKDLVLDSYFKILDFTRIYEYFGKTHRLIASISDDNVEIRYFCMDASELLMDTIKYSIHGIVFFSATLYPIDYHANLLTQSNGKYLELLSPFDSSNLDIIINNKVSTKYNNRNNTVDDIIEAIEILTKAKPGNYIVFFPSYQYLNMVADNINDCDYELIVQNNRMNDIERNEIIDKFKNTTNTKVGMFVMGGVFSEGIDFIGDALSGVIIVGVGLPLLCDENNLLKDYFDSIYEKGFDYAYTYPGITKVIQAVGRVIRDENDKGIAILMDERFGYNSYFNLYPPHWKNVHLVSNSYELKKEIERFKNEKIQRDDN
ncbi:MAG: ATP-dependent DNA helicase [Acholeplasmatales bacterium]|nr:ATP-dependent DNA helicase [Acholeplasmatales bacterium]